MYLFKSKLVKFFLKFLAIPALFATVIASASYGLIANSQNISTNLNAKNKIINQDNTNTNSVDQPTIDDVVNGDVSSLSQPVVTANGDYILPTLTSANIPGLIKVNSFVSPFYGINFNNFNGYHVRQVVQNYNNQNQYFVLLVNDNASVIANISSTTYSFTITNPGHVLAIFDNGSSFAITKDYKLDAPILDQDMLAYYAGMYFQAPLTSAQTQSFTWGTDVSSNNISGINVKYMQPWQNLSPNDLDITTTPQTTGHYETGTIGASSNLKKINDTWSGYRQNVATLLYLNSLNNMVFISGSNDNSIEHFDRASDAIYIFGGNKYINLWFYTFFVDDYRDTGPNDPLTKYASAWANYRVFWPASSNVTSTAYSSDIVTQKAYNNKLNFNDTSWGGPSSWNDNPYKNASFFGYYVSGAKLVNKPEVQIDLTLSIPNYALFNSNMPVVFTTNVFYDEGNMYQQPPQSTILNIFGSIPVYTGMDTTFYQSMQESDYVINGSWSTTSNWDPKYSNQNYNFVKFNGYSNGINKYSVDAKVNDGYQSETYNKLVAYLPEDIGNQNVALSYDRNSITAIINSNKGQTKIQKLLSSYYSTAKMDDLTNISFSGDTWLLTYKSKDATKSTTYFFTYNPLTNEVYFSQTNLLLADNLDLINVLPLASNFIYVLAKDTTTNKITPLLYKTNISGNYIQDTAFNSLINDASINKFEGIPAYATNGVQNENQKLIWGTVSFKNFDYLQSAGFLANPASVLADDSASFNTLVDYTPGWAGQDIKVSSSANKNNQLEVQVKIKYFNGLYYSPQELSAQNALTQVYGGFSALPSWVLPVAIAVPILFLAILTALGLGIGIPIAKNKKLQDKGFANTFRKVDTLTSAVGSVYKKIMTQIDSIKKKQPQMLESNPKRPNVSQAPQSVKPNIRTASQTINIKPNSSRRVTNNFAQQSYQKVNPNLNSRPMKKPVLQNPSRVTFNNSTVRLSPSPIAPRKPIPPNSPSNLPRRKTY